MTRTLRKVLACFSLSLGAAAVFFAGQGLAQQKQKGQGTVAANVDPKRIERGRHLVIITGCNDCHTAGYVQAEGKMKEDQWLLGDRLGFRGPWGTTYPTNLRLSLSKMSERQWIEHAKTLRARPPMPWFNLNAMSEADLGAMYQFVRSLQPQGGPAPEALPPGQEPPQPYVQYP